MQRFKDKSIRRKEIVQHKPHSSLSPNHASSFRLRQSAPSTTGGDPDSDSDTGLDATVTFRVDAMEASFGGSLSRAGSFSFRPSVRSTAMSIGPLLDGAMIEAGIRMSAILLSSSHRADDEPPTLTGPRRVASWCQGVFRLVDTAVSLPRWRQSQVMLHAVMDGLVLMCPQSYSIFPSLKLKTGVTIPLNPRALGAEVRDDAPTDHWCSVSAAAKVAMPKGSLGAIFPLDECRDGLVDWVVVHRKQLYHQEGREVAQMGGRKWNGSDQFLIVGSTSSPLSALRQRREVDDEAVRAKNAEAVAERRRAEKNHRRKVLLANVSQAFRPRVSVDTPTFMEPPPLPTAEPQPTPFTPTPPARQITTRGRRGSYAVPASEDVVRSVQSPQFFIACLCEELQSSSRSMEALTLCMHGEPLSLDMMLCVLNALDSRGGNPLQKLAITHAKLDTSGLLALAEWALRYPPSLVVRPVASLGGYASIHSSLHTLDLSGNNLVQSDLPILEAALLPLTGLRSLSLRNNPTLRYSSTSGSFREGESNLGFTPLTSLLWSLEGRIEHLDLGLCSLNNHAVIKLCSFLQEESRFPTPTERGPGRSRSDVEGYVPGRLSRVSVDGAVISHQVATYILQTVTRNSAIVEFGVGMVVACSSQAYASQLEVALAENLHAARCRAEVLHTSYSFRGGSLGASSSFRGGPPVAVSDLSLYPHPPLDSLAALSATRRQRLITSLKTRRQSVGAPLLEQLGEMDTVGDVPVESVESDGDSSDILDDFWGGALAAGYAEYTSNRTVPMFPPPSTRPKIKRAVEALAQLNPIEPTSL